MISKIITKYIEKFYRNYDSKLELIDIVHNYEYTSQFPIDEDIDVSIYALDGDSYWVSQTYDNFELTWNKPFPSYRSALMFVYRTYM